MHETHGQPDNTGPSCILVTPEGNFVAKNGLKYPTIGLDGAGFPHNPGASRTFTVVVVPGHRHGLELLQAGRPVWIIACRRMLERGVSAPT